MSIVQKVVPCSATGPQHRSKQAYGKTDTTPRSKTEFFQTCQNNKRNEILTMEHRQQVELRGSCGKVAGTRDLATASDGLKSRNADFVMASISMEILVALWFPTVFIDFRNPKVCKPSESFLATDPKPVFSVAGTNGPCKTI